MGSGKPIKGHDASNPSRNTDAYTLTRLKQLGTTSDRRFDAYAFL